MRGELTFYTDKTGALPTPALPPTRPPLLFLAPATRCLLCLAQLPPQPHDGGLCHFELVHQRLHPLPRLAERSTELRSVIAVDGSFSTQGL